MATSSSKARATRSSGTGVQRGTGRDREKWFALLDAWGAAGRPFREIADWLTGEHDLSRWWAQKLIVEYQQARGLRPAGVRPGGTFSVTASRTVGVPVERLFEAFANARLRRRWLPGAKMRVRTTERGRAARFDWEDGGTRVNATFLTMGKAKSQVGVEHTHLTDEKSAEKMKGFWRERLAGLKELLES
jgi:uncharacterized protein YndB with AHSA1/START domain